MQALNDALDSFKGEFTEGISPVTVNTMQLLVGSERCQFEFVSGLTSTTVVNHNASYDNGTKKFHCASGFVRYSYGTTMSANGDDATKTASVGEFTSDALTDADTPYYVYIRIAKSTPTVGNFVMSYKAYAYEVGSYIYLLLGILDKEQFGNRTWSPMYGYTEITPGRIRVDKIVSANGNTYFDLIKNEIAGKINFKDGLVSGSIGVGTAGNINAGMSGEGTAADSVRIWAGASTEKKEDANFVVCQDGSAKMGAVEIYGNSSIRGFLYQKGIVLNKNNCENYLNGKYLDIRHFGGNILFEDDDAIKKVPIFLPSFGYGVHNSLIDAKPEDYIGKIFRVQRSTNCTIGFTITGGIIIGREIETSSITGLAKIKDIFLRCEFVNFPIYENKSDKYVFKGYKETEIAWRTIRAFNNDGKELLDFNSDIPGYWDNL